MKRFLGSRKVLGSLVILALLVFPAQVIVAQETELEKTRKALFICNAELGNTMARIQRIMPKLKPEHQKQVRQRVQSLQAEVQSLHQWTRDQFKYVD